MAGLLFTMQLVTVLWLRCLLKRAPMWMQLLMYVQHSIFIYLPLYITFLFFLPIRHSLYYMYSIYE